MPMIDVDGTQINVETAGRADAPALMLSNSLGTNLHMWDAQVPEWSKHFRVIRYDHRGHGRSGLSPGPYSMDLFGRDAIAILNALKIGKASWVGLSMGGMIGQWLGSNAPERISRLVVSNTSSCYPDKAPWDGRIKLVQEKGLGAIVDGTMERWFTAGFRERSPGIVTEIKEQFVATPVAGYAACCEAIRDMDFRDSNARITAPTLVIAGKQDQAVPPGALEAIQKQIPRARLAVLDAAHLSNVELADEYTALVLNFLLAK